MSKKDVPLIQAEKTPEKDVVLDPKGFFVIEVLNGEIQVEYYTNVIKNGRIVSGDLQKVFKGKKADALCDTIVKHVPGLRAEHYMYLGRELARAEISLKTKEPYIQGGC